MGRRNQHSREQQQDMAITAAELLIVREGMAGLSMRKVAQAIGYTVGNLYLLFANQDVLLAAVNERTGDAVYAALRDGVDSEPDAARKPHALAAAYIAFGQRHPHRWRLLFEHSLPAEATRPQAVELRIGRLYELVESTLVQAVATLPEGERRLAATVLWSSVHGLCVLAVTRKLRWSGNTDARRYSDYLVDRYLAGLKLHAAAPG